jgi:hypothetical protein
MILADDYKSLLISQYANKPKASAEIGLEAQYATDFLNFAESVFFSFDIDSAVDDRLTKIGSLVGLRRSQIPQSVNNNDDYRFLLKAKITVNQASGYMVSDDRVSLQDAIQFSTDGAGKVLNNRNMSLTLQVDETISDERVFLLFDLELLPSPQGVYYQALIRAKKKHFGFSRDPDALGFGDINDPSAGGPMARLIVR